MATVMKEDRVTTTRERLYARLVENAVGHHNDATFAAMLSSWLCGVGAMPAWLGLEEARFVQLFSFHFPALEPSQWTHDCAAVDPDRLPESGELLSLLLQHRRGDDVSAAWMARVVVAGCLASDHLWQDLGLWSRSELSALIERNFPEMKARNDKDMKWKKFFYKQLCITEGIYTCRAPSCEVCADYAACFGPEE